MSDAFRKINSNSCLEYLLSHELDVFLSGSCLVAYSRLHTCLENCMDHSLVHSLASVLTLCLVRAPLSIGPSNATVITNEDNAALPLHADRIF